MPRLVCKEGLKAGLSFELEKKDSNIGRSVANNIVLPHDSVSPEHAVINSLDDQIVLTDLNSDKGTFVNNEKIDSINLKHGDFVKFGDIIFVFENVSDQNQLTKTPPEVKLICKNIFEENYEIKIETDETQIGRDESNQVKLFHKSISRKHCKFVIQDGKIILIDLNSTNGTFVNGIQIQEKEVFNDDEIKMGNLLFVIEIREAVRKEEEKKSESRFYKMKKEDFFSLDIDEIEGSLIQAEIQSGEPDLVKQPDNQVDIEEQTAVAKTITIEHERQKLYLLFEVTKLLMTFDNKTNWTRELPPIMDQLFDYKNFIIKYDDKKTGFPSIQAGKITDQDLDGLVNEINLSKSKSVIVNEKTKHFASLQQKGAGVSAILTPVLSKGKKVGLFYIDSEQQFFKSDQEIFEMLAEIISITIKKAQEYSGM